MKPQSRTKVLEDKREYPFKPAICGKCLVRWARFEPKPLVYRCGRCVRAALTKQAHG